MVPNNALRVTAQRIQENYKHNDQKCDAKHFLVSKSALI